MAQTVLRRSIGLFPLFFYGLGTIIGAGIYVLIGKVAAEAGPYLLYAFLLAGVIALFTALSYAELSARFPKSAGAVLYVQQAWQRQKFSKLIGALVAFTGIVSGASILNGFVGYLSVFVPLDKWMVIIPLACLLGFVAFWGIAESAWLITAITLLEVLGLIFVLNLAGTTPAVASFTDIVPAIDMTAMPFVFLGAVLAFYAFIGFEDMVNIVEEVKRPTINMPLAILLSIIVATFLYMAVAYFALRILPVSELAISNAPMADIVAAAGYNPAVMTIISMIAVINGALVQVIMASRLLYGMASQGMVPAKFGHVHDKRQTPDVATLVVTVVMLVFALLFPLSVLAKMTSMIMLFVFACVNASLLCIKRKDADKIPGFRIWIGVPLLGAGMSVFLMILQIYQWIKLIL